MSSAHNVHNMQYRERPLGEVINETKTELKDFVNTRIQMFKSEMNEKVGMVKTAAPAIAVGAVFALTAWFLLSLALVFLISMAFEGRPYQYALSFGIVGILYLLIGAVTAFYGWRTLKSGNLAPERTLRVLKQDQIWLQTEAKTQL